MRKRWPILAALFFLPASAHAGLQFSEIMYDPAGTNTGRQWIEIYNPDLQSIDLSEWTLFQGGVNHKIVTGGASGTPDILPANSYGVIAEDASKFLIDWPQYASLLFHASFTLKISGETISLNNQADQGTVGDQFTIDPTIGGKGDGNSLQKIIAQIGGGSSAWIAGQPSPGMANSANSANTTGTGTAGTTGSQSASDQSIATTNGNDENNPVSGTDVSQIDSDASEQVFCSITSGADYITGVPGKFSVQSWNAEKQPIINPQYFWNFGDGQSAVQQNLFHIYGEPGTYIATVSVGSGKYSSLCSKTTAVAGAQIIISNLQSGDGGFVELTNQSSQDVDLSGFILSKTGLPLANAFYFPEGSFIASSQPVRFSTATLGFAADDSIQLLYPNGALLSSYSASNSISDNAPIASDTAISGSTESTESPESQTPNKPASKSTGKSAKASAPKKPKNADVAQADSVQSASSSAEDSSSTDFASILAQANDTDEGAGDPSLPGYAVIGAALALIVLAIAVLWLYRKNWKKTPL